MLLKFKLLISVFLCTVAVMFVSCSLDSAQYSCDPEIEAWTKANVTSFAKASREDIAGLSLDRQRAMFRALSGEQKVELWKGKLESILTDTGLTDDEKYELESLISFLEPRHYETRSGLKEIQGFASAWETKMRSEYNWTDEKLAFYTHTWLTKQELDKAILQEGLSSLRISTRSEDNKKDCNCRYDSDCQYESAGDSCDSDKQCVIKRPGCGALNAFECDGLCGK